MALLRQLIELLLNPFFILLCLLGVSALFSWQRKYGAFVRIVLSLIFISFIILSTGWLPRFITTQLESHYPVIQKSDPTVHWVVVLSGGQNRVQGMPANDRLSAASIKRLVEGVRLFRSLPEATLVLSGGGSEGEIAEALLLNQVVQWFSIPKSRILLEQDSINTEDEARELKAIVHDAPFYLVTSAIHMPRAMILCQSYGLHPIAAPTDFTFFWQTENWGKMLIPNAYNLAYFSIAMHEILGRIWYGGVIKPLDQQPNLKTKPIENYNHQANLSHPKPHQ